MYRHILILPDGSEIGSGAAGSAVRSVRLTRCVNAGREPEPGSVCAAMLEVSLFGGGELAEGMEVALYRQDAAGERALLGLFTLEQPTRPTANTLRFTAFDRMTRLDRDMTAWLASLTGWPYTLLEFAKMVCAECGQALKNEAIPNGESLVPAFSRSCTGRQLMQWIATAACRFCRATAQGDIEFAWYEESGIRLGPGDYFAGALRFEDYETEPATAVVLRLSDGTLWPAGADNGYVISGNPLLGRDTAMLETIRQEMAALSYTPCRVVLPLGRGAEPGSILTVITPEGAEKRCIVMTAISAGQRETLECTGSPRRSSAAARNNPTDRDRTAAMEDYAAYTASRAVAGQTRQELADRLNGGDGPLMLLDGRLYIDAAFLQGLMGSEAFCLDTATGHMTYTRKTLGAQGEEVLITAAELGMDEAGDGFLNITRLNGKALEWTENPDGTFSLVGREEKTAES